MIDLADHVFSTSGMVRHACDSPRREFIIGTEVGLLHQLEKKCPGKVFYPLSKKAICVNMKKTNLAKVCATLEECKPRVTVPEDTAARARVAIQRMLDLPR